MSPLTYVASVRGDATLLTHGSDPLLTGAGLLLDAILAGHLDVIEGRRVVAGHCADGEPLLCDLRARVLGGAPGSPHEWIHRAAAFAPHLVACELVAAGVAAPLARRFQRQFTLSVDARAEAAARARIEREPALAGVLYARGVPTGDPLPPATFALPAAARAVLQTVRSASAGESLAARIAG